MSMMARSTNALQSKAGYIDARPHQPSRQSLLHRTAGPYIRVKLGPAAMSAPMFGLPESSHRADIGRLSERAIPVIAADCRRHLEKSLFAPVTNVTVLG